MGTAANTLGLSDVTPTLDSSVLEQSALAGTDSVTYTGTATITMDASACNDVVYLCVSVLTSGTAFTDSDLTNNYRCKDISQQLSCAIGKYNSAVLSSCV